MDGREDEIVLVAQGRPRLVAPAREDRASARSRSARGWRKRRRPARAPRGRRSARRVVVARLEQRREPRDGVGELAGPGEAREARRRIRSAKAEKPARARAGSENADIESKPSSSPPRRRSSRRSSARRPAGAGRRESPRPDRADFGEAHQRESVLHMGGVEELEAAELDEGDVAPRQLQPSAAL